MKMPLNHQITHVAAVLDLDGVEGEAIGGLPAVEQARRVARRTRSALSLLAFTSPGSPLAGLQAFVSDTQRASDAVELPDALYQLAETIEREEGLTVHCELRDARFDVDTIIDWLTFTPVDLLVLNKPSRQSAAAMTMDPISRLIRQTGIPVWFAQPGTRPQAGVVAAVSEGAAEPAQAARALDFEVIDAARGVGELFDANLHVVQACPTPALPIAHTALTLVSGSGAATRTPALYADGVGREERLRSQKRALKSFARVTGAEGAVDHFVVSEGDAPEVISGSAQALQAGLIVMGASEKSRWEALLLGGTAESTLTLAPCDVLFVKNVDGDHVQPKALLSQAALEAEPESEEVDLVVNPRRFFASPLQVLRDESLGRRSKVQILEAWREELLNESINEERMPHQVYDHNSHREELSSVGRALVRLGALEQIAA